MQLCLSWAVERTIGAGIRPGQRSVTWHPRWVDKAFEHANTILQEQQFPGMKKACAPCHTEAYDLITAYVAVHAPAADQAYFSTQLELIRTLLLEERFKAALAELEALRTWVETATFPR